MLNLFVDSSTQNYLQSSLFNDWVLISVSQLSIRWQKQQDSEDTHFETIVQPLKEKDWLRACYKGLVNFSCFLTPNPTSPLLPRTKFCGEIANFRAETLANCWCHPTWYFSFAACLNLSYLLYVRAKFQGDFVGCWK